ncbi:MAG: EpsG family protein [Bacteroidales bacterium]|nr:EpsG family protein [Bacteroidales bacterium]
MYFYLLIALLIAILAYQYDIKNKSAGRSFWEKCVVTLLIVIVGLRYHIGSDTVVYEWHFKTIETPVLSDFFQKDNLLVQPLWAFVMSFCKTVFGSFIAVQFFHAIVYHVLAFRFIKKTTQYTFTALLFFFILLWFANSFEVLRESISSVIFLNSLFLLREKKFIKYILCAIVAMGFHSFAFIMFVLAPLVVFSNKYVLCIICALIYIVVQFVDLSEINRVLISVMAFSDTIGNKATIYIGQKDSTVISFLGLIRLVFIGLFLPICVILFSDKKDSPFVKLVIFWMLLMLLKSKLPILYRMNNYLQLIYIVLLVNLLYNNTRTSIKSLKPLLIALSCGVLIMGYVDVYRPDPSFQSSKVPYDIRYFPYRTVFQDPVPMRESESYY